MPRPKHPNPRDLLTVGMTRFEGRLHRRLVAETLRRFKKFRADRRRGDQAIHSPPQGAKWRKGVNVERRRPENAAARHLLDFLRVRAHHQLDELTVLAARHAEFRRNLARVADRDETRQLLLDYAAEFGTTWRQRLGDRRALSRWLDEEALNDRFLRRRGELELELQFVLGRFGTVLASTVQQLDRASDVIEMWERLGVEPLVRDALEYNGDRRVRVAAMRCLAHPLRHIASTTASQLVGHEVTVQVQRVATDPSADTWLQCSAIDSLAQVDEELFAWVIEHRCVSAAGGDDLFVRRHCLKLAAERPERFADCQRLWDHAIKDPSPAVRQQLASSLWRFPSAIAWPLLTRIIRDDPCFQVRAAAMCASIDAVERSEFRAEFLCLLAERVTVETDSFCQRTALHVAVKWLDRWQANPRDSKGNVEVEKLYAEQIVPAICRLQTEATEVPCRRWAADALEQLWVRTDPIARDLAAHLAPRLEKLRRGQSCRIPSRWRRDVDPDTLGRTLAVLTQEDFGVELIRGLGGHRIVKQPTFGFRCWRAWSEFWRPATDKRQAYRHTIGRISHGTVRSPSRIMGELSATKVPGEPLVIPDDGTWRPFLPLVDDFVSALNQSVFVPRATRLYSSEGVTEIKVSRNPVRRAWAAMRLIGRFPSLAKLRNWDASSSQPPAKYLQAVQRIGFRVTFRPHAGRRPDSSVTQFFPALLAFGSPSLLLFLQDLVKDYAYYFSSAFENTLTQLVVFAAAVLALFLVRHAMSNLAISAARRKIPLSIGGWGTRGKSGTERLKAALFTEMGHSLISKTTGCEAMFIHVPAYGDPLEIPLYRPGDKATIWEQSNLLRLASGMRPSVFLWECMALTPEYVDVLQQQWMHDDLATITNTYPDHEDLQGPSGMDVANTISAFVPHRSHLITTEEQMCPMIRERCKQRHTTLRNVKWLDSGLITDDLLDRFPYQEHSSNIALVAAMADELGCSFDFAVKAMADHLVPDLGVLKTHPASTVQACSIEFTNGMSANERFGCLGNWQRLGFDQISSRQDRALFVSTVVNNRADRVARSRVFASVIVNDLAADRHFLIGGNLKGLQGFIWDAWTEYERSVSLRREGEAWNAANARQIVDRLARRFRVPTSDDQIRDALQSMLTAALPEASDGDVEKLASDLRNSADACAQRLRTRGATDAVVDRVTDHLRDRLTTKQQFDQLLTAIDNVRSQSQVDELERQVRKTLRQWFARKIVVIQNQRATGDEIIQRIVDETPPGYLNRVMGIQNIKGTGLDFVYRFHAWDTCHRACRLLETPDEDARTSALNMLESLQEYGLLCQEQLQGTIEHALQASPPLTSAQHLQLDAIGDRLTESMHSPEKPHHRGGAKSEPSMRPWVRWALSMLEQWMEVQDGVRRRKRADQIYRDLRRERIGRRRAINELRKLNNRQKGGWLASRVLGHHD